MRANALALAGGKAIGLTLLLTAMCICIPPALHAQARRRGADAGNERAQHGLGAARRVPRVLYAGRLRDARGRLRPLARIHQHPRRRHRRHLHLRVHVLGVGLCLHVRAGQRVHRHDRLLPEGHPGHVPGRPAFRCSRSGSSSSRSPTPARRSRRAPWSAAAASSATFSTASASPASSIRSSATGPGDRTAGWPSCRRRSATSPARRSCTASAARFRWSAPSRSARASAGCSGATAAARCCRTTSSSARSAA